MAETKRALDILKAASVIAKLAVGGTDHRVPELEQNPSIEVRTIDRTGANETHAFWYSVPEKAWVLSNQEVDDGLGYEPNAYMTNWLARRLHGSIAAIGLEFPTTRDEVMFAVYVAPEGSVADTVRNRAQTRIARAWRRRRGLAGAPQQARGAVTRRSAGAETARALNILGALCTMFAAFAKLPSGARNPEWARRFHKTMVEVVVSGHEGQTKKYVMLPHVESRYGLKTPASTPAFSEVGARRPARPGTLCPLLTSYLRTHPRSYVSGIQLRFWPADPYQAVTEVPLHVAGSSPAANSKNRAMALLKQHRWKVLEPALRGVHRPGGPIMRRQLAGFIAEQAGRSPRSHPVAKAASASVQKRRLGLW